MPTTTRQLAAIMFTDIQGYTALMQKDEKHAFEIRKRHRKVFNEQTKMHNGKILQYYGDGTLSIFNSAIDAVNCGIEMQQAFQVEPVVPVRIGIHTGDILLSDEEIIGDGVNVASRIESIAVPGSVLISGKVYDEIKNHSGIQSLTLRSFIFKNVEKPIEVFAISNEGLVIPDVTNIQSKSEKNQAAPSQTFQTSRKSYAGILWGMGIAAVVILSIAIVILFPGSKTKPITSIAVLPLDDISEGSKGDYYSAGMTEALIAELSKIKALRVISRTSAMQYKDTQKSVPEIARELNIDALIEGSVIRTENEVRIIAQLIGTNPERHIWAQTFDRDLVDILSLYSEVATAIAEEVEIAITPEERVKISNKSKVKPEALEAFLKGKYHAGNKSAHGLFTGLKYFESAIEIDSTFADAFAWLAYTYIEIGNFGFRSSNETYPKAMVAAERALELNHNLHIAHACVGRINMVYHFDWKSAEQSFEKALAINVNHSMSLEWYADYYFATGKFDKSIEFVNKSIDIDPFSRSTLLHLGQIYWLHNDYDKAIVALEKVIELDPNLIMAYLFLGNVYTNQGLYAEGLTNLSKIDQLTEGGHPLVKAGIAINYALSGKEEEAYILLKELESISNENSAILLWIAGIYAVLDKEDVAMEWLHRSYEQRSNSLFLLDNIAYFESLRSLPEFKSLQKQIGLGP